MEGLTESLSKELNPAWNIKAVIIEPGGFRTEWAGDSMKTLPLAAQYADSPAAQFRNTSLGSHKAIGDPRKAGEAFIRVANLPNPPLRIQFGTESMAIIVGQAKATIRDAEQHAEIAHSTNFDGVDKEKVLEMLATHVAK
jgi:hypothetical protein